jgi:hypothetical protein
MKRIILLALAIAALTFGLVDAANAACVQQGTISRVVTTPGAATTTTIYLTNNFPNLIVWSATTTDAKIAEMVAAAQATHSRATITGNAAVCPTTGVPRPMGVITVLQLD